MYVLCFAYLGGSIIIIDMLHIAVWNSQLLDLANLYKDAFRDMCEAGLRLEEIGDPRIRFLSRHAAIFGTYADVDRYKARLFGFAWDYGTLRAL